MAFAPLLVQQRACSDRGERRPPHAASQVEGRVLRVDRDGLLVDEGGRLGLVRHGWAEVGERFVRVLRRVAGEGTRARLPW